METFKNTQIVMVTYMPYEMLAKFYNDYHIGRYPNIIMGRDNKFFFTKFFKLKIMPSTFVYDSRGNFKNAFRERVDMPVLARELQN